MSRQSVPSARAEVRMVAQPASVPAARRFVTEALTDWGRETLADDVCLCVSELATNATLHSGTSYFHIELQERSGAVRLAVTDAGMGPVDVLARQPELSDASFQDGLTADGASTTGRGMFLVSALATTWGIDELSAGKRIWAEFSPTSTAWDVDAASPTDARMTWSAEREPPALDPGDWAVVRFRGCPPALLVAHDDNLDEYIRELQLLGDRLAEPSFQALGAVLGGYVAEHAANWDAARVMARDAVRHGRDLMDIDVLATRNIRESIRFLRSMLAEVEALSRQGRLMTLPAKEPVQRLRDWLEGEFISQIEDGAEPLSYLAWLAGERR